MSFEFGLNIELPTHNSPLETHNFIYGKQNASP
jgi:hypothetical protein